MYANIMSKILVTGANGFVGRHLVEELLRSNYQVIAIGGSGIPALDTEGVQYLNLDLMDPDEVKKIDFMGVDGVIHLAGWPP